MLHCAMKIEWAMEKKGIKRGIKKGIERLKIAAIDDKQQITTVFGGCIVRKVFVDL